MKTKYGKSPYLNIVLILLHLGFVTLRCSLLEFLHKITYYTNIAIFKFAICNITNKYIVVTLLRMYVQPYLFIGV